MNKKIDYVSSDDWVVVYVNGYATLDGHNVTNKQLTDLMREHNTTIVNYHVLNQDGSEHYENQGDFPKYFENIDPEYFKK